MKRNYFRISIFILFSMPLLGASVDDKSFFAARRERLLKKIEGSIAVLQGAADTRAYAPFRQSNDFYYLTGVEVPGAFLVLDGVRNRSLLFLPPQTRMSELWDGPRLHPGSEARELTGCDDVLEDSKLQDELENRKLGAKTVYTPFRPEETAATSRDRAERHDLAQEKNPWDGRVSRAKAFAQSLKKKLGDSPGVRDLSPLLDEMRRIKDAQEIDRMREAGRIGSAGMMEAIRAAKPGIFEYQLAAISEFLFKWNGAAGPAYFPIVGSGQNSCFLHYHDNSRKMEAGELVVMDFGPDYRYYHTDITRTFPVSGKFSEEQAKIYQIVLDAQKAALAKIRPGATMGEINSAARDVISRAGFIQNLPHGVSHYVGMSTHDVGDVRSLEPGVVLTVEPGIYIPEKKLGVRIEDTVLVTSEGCEILSKSVPKELREIERLKEEGTSIAPKKGGD